MSDRSQILLREKRERAARSKEAQVNSLKETVYKARMYHGLLEHGAWKHFLSDYLDAEMDPARLVGYLYSDPETLRNEMLKMQALWEMMAYIQQRVRDGEKAIAQLHKLGVREENI